jgi:hypothetical protein
MTTFLDITLVSGATTITIPGDALEWVDRYKRNLVAQNREITAGGSQVVEEFQQVGGYPITLATTDGTWISKAIVDALLALADAPLTTPMTLTYNDGTTYLVRFLYDGSTSAIDAEPVWDGFPRDSSFPHTLTIRLVQSAS